MTNIFTRIKDSLAADIHHILDEKEQRNPIVALNQFLRQAEQQKDKVRKTLERHYRLKDEFTREFHEAEDQANKRLHQANIAKVADEIELYNFAMKEYEEFKHRADRMKQARQDTIEQIDQLERKYKEMNHKLKDMHLKRMELMGRENVAKATHQINQVLKDDIDKPITRFYELERFIENIESRVNQSYFESTFDQKIADLERNMKKEEN